jgi:hypothetical protein
VNSTRILLAVFVLTTLLGWQAFAASGPQDADQKQAPAATEKSEKGPAFKTEKGTVSGTLTVVAPDKKFVSVKDSSGTSFAFKTKASTKITVGGQKAKLEDLSSAANKQATVNYTALRTGNVAQSIEVTQ